MPKRKERVKVYPVVLVRDEPGYVVKVSDLGITTEGEDLADAIGMARDAIGMKILVLEDEGLEIPAPYSKFVSEKESDIETLIDVDIVEYRKKNDTRMVRKNCTIPYYLKAEAESRNINFSKVLQDALHEKLGI